MRLQCLSGKNINYKSIPDWCLDETGKAIAEHEEWSDIMMVDTKKWLPSFFYVIIDTKERKLIFMGRPKGGKNLYHSKEEKLALVYIQAY